MTPASWNEGQSQRPNLNFDAFEVPRFIRQFNRRFSLGNLNLNAPHWATAYSHVVVFFDGVIDALKAMKGRVVLELLSGDLLQTLSLMRASSLPERPTKFPCLYDRAWISNVPYVPDASVLNSPCINLILYSDYMHGPLNTAVYCLPSLNAPGSVVAANCLLNSGVWHGADEFCYTCVHSSRCNTWAHVVEQVHPPATGRFASIPGV
jgi:hypothetical protein